jgi:hypothetical protein
LGVIRPGRRDNPLYGVTFGLRLQTGQVKSLFTHDEAKAICKWILDEAGISGAIRETSFIFEFPAEAFTQDSDKGRRDSYCRPS